MDEPYLKAKFHLHINHYKNQKATSNTPVESVQIELVYTFFKLNLIKLKTYTKIFVKQKQMVVNVIIEMIHTI